jgi:hypothetical protein
LKFVKKNTWAITRLSTLFTLAANGSNMDYVFVLYKGIPAFWILVGFYISQERQHKRLYALVAKKNQSEIDFSLVQSNIGKGK